MAQHTQAIVHVTIHNLSQYILPTSRSIPFSLQAKLTILDQVIPPNPKLDVRPHGKQHRSHRYADDQPSNVTSLPCPRRILQLGHDPRRWPNGRIVEVEKVSIDVDLPLLYRVRRRLYDGGCGGRRGCPGRRCRSSENALHDMGGVVVRIMGGDLSLSFDENDLFDDCLILGE